MSKFFTEDDVRIAADNGISRDLLTTRMVDGWELERAITQPARTRRVFTKEENELIKRSGFARSTILKRLATGLSLEEACEMPLRQQEQTHDKLRLWSQQEATRLRRLENAKERRHREQKPHLYNGTPQKGIAGDWYKHLAQYNIFPRKEVNQ